MLKLPTLCQPVATNSPKTWLYYEYYLGRKDQENRKNGYGQNHWSGAESIEWYTGKFLRNTMHGFGEYRWRYRGKEGLFVTYEGNFYVNRMHGYGTMSYPDGKVFTGIFYDNMRYGPGVESCIHLQENVGLWSGARLVRLAWRTPEHSVVPDFLATPNGRTIVEGHRVKLVSTQKTVGEVNSALQLLKECGSEPITAAENWNKLYPRYCTDLASDLCQVKLFENVYYNGKVYSLEKVDGTPDQNQDTSQNSQDSFENLKTYYAWNNNQMTTDIMQHCYKHERQRKASGIKLLPIMSGPRKRFRPAATHELDCRTLLMACYLGHVASTAFLINEREVDPNIADMQGNSAIMYAACGDQIDIINLIVGAGGDVDSLNDACCTALGIALIRYACTVSNIAASGIVQAVLTPPIVPAPAPVEQNVNEWNINRDIPPPQVSNKTEVTSNSVKESGPNKGKKPEAVPFKLSEEAGYESDDSINEENKLYKNIYNEYAARVKDLFSIPSIPNPIPYLFDYKDIVKEIEASEAEDQKKVPEKNAKKAVSKVLKDPLKLSRDVIWPDGEREKSSLTIVEKLKAEALERIMATILQLLHNGANPNYVKCPQPALLIAAVSGNADLVRYLIKYGANVYERFPEMLNYTVLDLIISRVFTLESIDILRALLESGCSVNHRLYSVPVETEPDVPEIPGPTLLHAVLARKLENEYEEDIRRQVLEVLLEYHCNPVIIYKGRSAFDIATKNMDLLDIVVKSPVTDLNAIINENNQTILVKMFSLPYFKTIGSSERLQMLTNLLLFGADPLSGCQNGDTFYYNLFVFAKTTLEELESSTVKQSSPTGKADPKAKKEETKPKDIKSKGLDKLSVKSAGRVVVDDVGDYKQAIDLVTECARLLHIRWLQSNLMKKLIGIINKVKHRHWSMITKELKKNEKKPIGLWLTSQRCLEIWDLLKTTNKKIYNDKCILKHVLCIVHYFQKWKTLIFYNESKLTAVEKDAIEFEVEKMFHEHKMATNMAPEMQPWKRLYVQPELFISASHKFNVCFDCALPYDEEKVTCKFCQLVTFCNMDCMKNNIQRANCHPCSIFLKEKYFPSGSSTETKLSTV